MACGRDLREDQRGLSVPLPRSRLAIRNTLEFLLSCNPRCPGSEAFFTKALAASHTVTPCVITVDKNAVYPKAFSELKAAGVLAVSCELGQSKYLNNLIEQDHRAHQAVSQTRNGLLFV